MSRDAEGAAVVLLSGGLDSATVLALAIQQGYSCHAMSFDYGQKHRIELDCARRQAATAASHHVVPLPRDIFSASALTNREQQVPDAATGAAIPETYVPARNTVFLAMALALAESLNCRSIFIGANAVDYPGYPDCRPEFMDAFERLANTATRAAAGGARMHIKAPLLHWSKQDIIRTGLELGVDYGSTVSCYRPDDKGRACGNCDSCSFRLAGFAAVGQRDPAAYIPGTDLP